MIGSTTPIISTDVMRADMADRLRAAEAGRDAAAMRRELRAARAEERRVRRSTPVVAAAPRHVHWRVGWLTHHWGA